MVLAIACNCGWPVLQLDVEVTFLPAKIEDNSCLKTAPGRDKREKNGEMLYYKLKTSLYALPLSSNLWCGTMDKSLLEVGFIATKSGPCVYTYDGGNALVSFILYMDDILLTGHKAAQV